MSEINVETKAQKDKYISYMMKKLPDAEKGEARTLKKGDSLWNIAKEAVGGSKATNAEISEYMLLLAKANGLDTYDKMNRIKASDTIYMPKVSGVKTETKTKSPTQSKQLTRAEESAKAAISKLFNNSDVKIEKASMSISSTLYHAYVMESPNNVFAERYRPVMSFRYDNGEISDITFEDNKTDLFTYGYDYRMKSDGKIYQRNNLSEKTVGKLDKSEIENLKTHLEKLLSTAKRVP